MSITKINQWLKRDLLGKLTITIMSIIVLGYFTILPNIATTAEINKAIELHKANADKVSQLEWEKQELRDDEIMRLFIKIDGRLDRIEEYLRGRTE